MNNFIKYVRSPDGRFQVTPDNELDLHNAKIVIVPEHPAPLLLEKFWKKVSAYQPTSPNKEEKKVVILCLYAEIGQPGQLEIADMDILISKDQQDKWYEDGYAEIFIIVGEEALERLKFS